MYYRLVTIAKKKTKNQYTKILGFLGDMKEQTLQEIAIHDMDATAVDLLLDYAYTGHITITADNVQVRPKLIFTSI